MQLELTLDAEQLSALDDLLADYNAGRSEPLTAKVYLETVVIGLVDERVKRNFEAVASALVSAAKSAPYEKRLELIELVQSTLSEP